MPDLSNGLKNDYDRLVATLNKILTSDVSFGVGHKYDQAAKDDASGLLKRLNDFWTFYKSIDSVLRQVEKPRDAKDLIDQIKGSKDQSVYDAHEKLLALMTDMSTYINQIEVDFTSDMYKRRHTSETGIGTSAIEALHLSSIFGNDFQDVVNAISPFKSSVADVLKLLERTKTVQDNFIAELAAATTKNKSDYGAPMKPPVTMISKEGEPPPFDVTSEPGKVDTLTGPTTDEDIIR